MYQYWVINCRINVSNVRCPNRGTWGEARERGKWELSGLSAQFAINLKLLWKIKSIDFFKSLFCPQRFSFTICQVILGYILDMCNVMLWGSGSFSEGECWVFVDAGSWLVHTWPTSSSLPSLDPLQYLHGQFRFPSLCNSGVFFLHTCPSAASLGPDLWSLC